MRIKSLNSSLVFYVALWFNTFVDYRVSHVEVSGHARTPDDFGHRPKFAATRVYENTIAARVLIS